MIVGATTTAGSNLPLGGILSKLQAAHSGIVMLLDPKNDEMILEGSLVNTITDGAGGLAWTQAGGARPTLAAEGWGDGSPCLNMTASTYLRNAYANGGAAMNPGSNSWLFIMAFSAPAAQGWKIAAGQANGSADGMRLYTTPTGAIATYNGTQPMSTSGTLGVVLNTVEQVVGWGVDRPNNVAIKVSTNEAEVSRYAMTGTNPASVTDAGNDFNIWGRADGNSDYGTGNLRLACMIKRPDAETISIAETADIIGSIAAEIGL